MDKLTPSLFLTMQNNAAAWRSSSSAGSRPPVRSEVSRELYADDARTAGHLGDVRRNLEDSVSLSPAAQKLAQ